MSDEYNSKLETKSDSVADAGSTISGSSKEIDYVPPKEIADQHVAGQKNKEDQGAFFHLLPK